MAGVPTDPRALRTRESMLAAAASLLAEEGLDAVTHQAVATRARVGRATVYRHWPQLLDLRLAVLSAAEHVLPAAPAHLSTASGTDPRVELAFHLRTIAVRLDKSAGVVIAAIIGGAEHDAGMRRLRTKLAKPMIDSLRPAVAEAVQRGLLQPDVTAEVFAMAAIGPLFYQRYLLGEPLGAATVDAALDTAWQAYAATSAPRPHPRRGTNAAGRASRGKPKSS